MPDPAGAADRRPTAAELAQLRQRFVALALAMQADDPFDEDGDNETIPAGYTYLMQFVAHDIVNTEVPIRALGVSGRETRDLAVTRLRLGTLYGGGPAACPFAYASGARSRLRIAPIGRRPGDPAVTPLRDIPRTRLDPLPPAAATPPLDEALPADPRNDDNSNVAQMTVLFSAFHNAIEAGLAKARLATRLRYAVAREAATLVYRRILREDLLPKLLHPRVWDQYKERDTVLLDQPRDRVEAAAMPLEFCLGAFRCGHAMVRERYQINDTSAHDLTGILRATSGGSSGAMPLSREWIIRWSHFFEMTRGGRPRPNPSRKLRPQLSPGLLDSFVFGIVDESNQVGLVYRDLLGAGVAGLHTVDALCAHLAAQRGDLAQGKALFEPAGRKAALLDWLRKAEVPEEHATALADDPPLPFYVLFEAEHERGGLSLGTLGSVIVAETILGILARDPLPCQGGDSNGDAAAALRRLSTEVGLPAATLDALRGIKAMPDLVRFAATASGIGARNPRFI